MNIKYPDSVTSAEPITESFQDPGRETKASTTSEELAIKEGEQNLKEREKYAKYTFIFVSVWTLAIIAIGFCQGFALWSFNLSDPILGTLMGGTMIKVLGTFYIILNYLFKPKK